MNNQPDGPPEPYYRLLKALEEFTSDPEVQRALFAGYGGPTAANARLRELMSRIVGDTASRNAPFEDLEIEAKDRLIESLLAERVRIAVEKLEGRRAVNHINARKAACLWLGSRQQESAGLSGLWRLWETVLPDEAPLPDLIREIFAPPSLEGGEQAYLDACHITLTAFVVKSEAEQPLALQMTVAEAHRRLARMLLHMSGDEATRFEAKDRTLCSALARAFGVPPAATSNLQLHQIRDAALEAARKHSVDSDDAATMLTWIVGTCVKRRDGSLAAPEAVCADEVGDSAKKNHIHVDLLRGRTTLRDRLVRRVLDVVQSTGAAP